MPTRSSIASIDYRKSFQSYDNIIVVSYDAKATDKQQYNTSQNIDKDGEMNTTEILIKTERIKIGRKKLLNQMKICALIFICISQRP